MKRIYSFEDYREYLAEYYLSQKEISAGFSYAVFSKRARIKSPNFLKLVIDGKKNLTVRNIHHFAEALGLSDDEHSYFEAMVLHNQAESEMERRIYRARMSSIRASKPKRSSLGASDAILEKWYYPAMLLGMSGREPEAWQVLAKNIGIDAAESAQVESIILREGMLELRDGKYVLNQDHWLFHDKKSAKRSHQGFLASQMERSSRALKTQYSSGARFFAHTLTVSQRSFDKHVNEIQALLEKMTSDVDGDCAAAEDQVAQLNIQFFRVL